MENNFVLRIIFDLLLLVLIISGLWYIALIIGIVSVWRFSYFIELMIFGILFDSLFGYSQELGIYGYGGTVVSIILFILINLFKNVLRR